jgi:hypothetical protein
MKRKWVYAPLLGMFFGVLFLNLTGCKSFHKHSSATSETEVKVKMLIFEPYCKGAAPEPGSEYQSYVPDRNNRYFIRIFKNNNRLVDETSDSIPGFFSQTDDEGFLHLRLQPGTYGIQLGIKGKPFSEFYRQFNIGSEGDQIKHMGKDCYLNWWKTCEAVFEISSGKHEKQFIWLPPVLISKQCFTGVNPCMIYDGPMPP